MREMNYIHGTLASLFGHLSATVRLVYSKSLAALSFRGQVVFHYFVYLRDQVLFVVMFADSNTSTDAFKELSLSVISTYVNEIEEGLLEVR